MTAVAGATLRTPAAAAPRPLRVEMVVPTLAAAGMETLVVRLAEGLGRRGHDVGVTCTIEEGPLAAELRAAGLRASLVPAPGLRTNVWPSALSDHLRRLAPDVVHLHDGVWLKGARAAQMAGVPRVIGTLHGIESPEPLVNHVFRRIALRLLDHVVPVSQGLADYLRRDCRVRPDRMTLVNNGVDVAHFRPDPAGDAARAARGDGALVIGTVARLAPVKNQAMLLDAFARVRSRVPEARLVLVGDGPLRGALEAQCAALGLGPHVEFAGLSDDTAAAYRAFDVFALTSHFEGTSVSMLEAMASGTCVVATAVGGTPALLGDGAYGVLVPPGDAEAFAEALVGLLRDPARRAALAAGARARVCEGYSTAAMVRGYEELYYGQGVASSTGERSLCAG